MRMEKKNKQQSGALLLRILIIVIAAAVFLYAGYKMYLYWVEGHKSTQERERLAQKAVTVLQPETAPVKPSEAETPDVTEPQQETEPTEPPGPNADLTGTIPIRVDFEALAEESSSIIGWIYSEGTPINYPIVQGEDNQYYLRKLANGEYNYGGSIFADFRNTPDLSDRNTLIYGHNLTDDSMFGTLIEYKKQDYYEKRPHLWILTPEMAYRVDLVAGVVTPSDSDAYTLFESQEALHSYLADAVSQSKFQSNVDIGSVERIVTLSTCSYEFNAARFVVIGSLVPITYGE